MFGDILLAERQRLAQRIITAFEQRRIVRSAVTEIGRIVGVAGEGPLLLGLHGVARHADVAVQVAGRELVLHPAVGLGDQRVGLVGRTRVEHIDVIGESARLLPVAEQFRTMQFHPRIERALLDPCIGLARVLGTRRENEEADRSRPYLSERKTHNTVVHLFRYFVYRTEKRYGTLLGHQSHDELLPRKPDYKSCRVPRHPFRGNRRAPPATR